MSTQRGRSNTVGLVLVVGALLLIVYGLSRSFTQLMGKQQRIAEAEQELERLELEKQRLQQALAVDEKFVIESEIRDTLGLSKPGETVIFLPEIEHATPSARPSIQPVEATKPNWQKWWEVYFGESE